VAVIVTAHQPTYLPGVSVMAKIARADAVVWLDDVRFTTPGFVNRNQLPDGTWLTVPVERRDHRTTVREVVLAGESWRAEHSKILHDHYSELAHFEPRVLYLLNSEWADPGGLLVDLNYRMLDLIFEGLGFAPVQQRESTLDFGRGGSLSSRLARMVRAVGGTAYLAAPSRRLDPHAFAAEGVELLAFDFAGPNPSVIDPLFRTGQLPTAPRQEVTVA
jgi:hypothetical protein